MRVKGTVLVQERDRRFQCTRPPEPSRMFERKRRIVLSGRVPNIREVRQCYIGQRPGREDSLPTEFSSQGVSLRRQSDSTVVQQATSGAVYPRAVYPLGTHPMVIVSEQRLRESLYGGDSRWRWSLSTARQCEDGEGAIPWRDSKWISMEYSHGNTASIQRMARERWRESGRTVRDSGVHMQLIPVLTSDRACSGMVKHWASVQRQSEGGTG
jgi:hypothetical protein